MMHDKMKLDYNRTQEGRCKMEKATIYDYAKMCRKHAILDCIHCPLSHDNNGLGQDCGDFMRAFTDKANEIILKWCKEHPVKTRQDMFLKIFPNAPTLFFVADEALDLCPQKVDKTVACNCQLVPCPDCKRKYWLAEVEEIDLPDVIETF